MRATNLSAFPIITALTVLVCAGVVDAQEKPQPIQISVQMTKKPVDEFKSMLNAIEEAYKAPREVDEDVRDELRKQYKSPTPEREAKIFREIRRLYAVNAEREEAILQELKRAYEQQSPQQEERLFREIRRGGTLPLGTVSPQAQTDLSARLFARLDLDANGMLGDNEQPETLRNERGKWDRNLDGSIILDEYQPYYQASIKTISAKVASGEIFLRAANIPAAPELPAAKTDAAKTDDRPMVARFGKLPQGLPDWFAKYDRDADGQVGLYEWVKAGKSIEEFNAMDRNGDGLLEAAELLRFLAEQATAKAKQSNPQ